MALIVCDLDRTLIPNGTEPDDSSLSKFYQLIAGRTDITLAYATGRNLALFKQAEVDFGIKKPDFLLGAVGTEVFKNTADGLKIDPDWYKYLEAMHPNWFNQTIVNDLEAKIKNDVMWMQENDVQNRYKISYYLKTEDYRFEIVEIIENYLGQNQIEAEVVYSFDPHKNLGLIDILPIKATKLGALEFLINKLKVDREDVIYSGDSGNDLLPLTAGIKAVLVNNAREDVKAEAIRLVTERNFEDRLYISKENYAAGVIEGLKYFGVL